MLISVTSHQFTKNLVVDALPFSICCQLSVKWLYEFLDGSFRGKIKCCKLKG